jgi:hypothetical protein
MPSRLGSLLLCTLFAACMDAGATTANTALTADEANDAAGPRPPHGPPPQAAIDACNGKSAGDDCSFTADGRTLNGRCVAPPPGAPADAPALACLPPPPPPPPEAIEACNGKAAGDDCTVTTPDGNSIAGKCVAPPPGAPADAQIACMPPMAGGCPGM